MAAYVTLQQISTNLYVEADAAIELGNYHDASLLESQADNVFQFAENLITVIKEHE